MSAPVGAVRDVGLGTGVAAGAGAAWRSAVEDAPVAVTVAAPGGVPGEGGAAALAVVGSGGLVTVLDAAGRTVATAVVGGGGLTAAWSPEGTVLGVGGPEGAYRWTESTGLEPLQAGGWCQALAWAADGRLAVADDRSAAVFDPGSLAGRTVSGWVERAWCTPEVASTVTGLAWLRDGRELAVAGYGGVRAFSRARLARELAYAGSLLAVAVSPDGRWLVSGNQDASVHVWRLRDGEELEMAGYPRKVTRVAFDVTGRWLAADGGPVATVWDFSGKGPGGTAARMLPAPPDGATALAWHPRLPLLATGGADGAVAVWDVATASAGREAVPLHRVVVRAGDPVTALAWLGGTTVVAAVRSGMVAALPCG